MKLNFQTGLGKISGLAFLLMFILSFNQAFSATKTWNNLAGGPWTTNGNWTPSGAPAANDDIIIPALTSSLNSITAIPTITLNSLTMTGSGGCILESATSGNTVTIRTTWVVPSTYTLSIGASGARIAWTCSTTCNATLNGYVAFDAGTTNRNFIINGTLTVNSTGGLYDPNPSAGSDLYINAGATLRTSKSQGFTTTSAPNAAGLNFNVAICFGGAYSYASGVNYEYNATGAQATGTGFNQNTPATLTVNLSSGQDLTLSGAASISSALIMTSGDVNLNGLTLTLGISAASPGTLTRTNGVLYGGTFSRWFTTTAFAIPSTTGLFPMGTSVGDYRPLWLGYSANLTTAGRVNVNHTGTYPSTTVTVNYNDASWGNTVVGVSNSFWTVSTTAIAFNGSTAALRYGGTGFGTNFLTDLNASLAASAIGTHGASTSANTTYEVNRSVLTTAQVANAWRIGTKNGSTSPLPIGLSEFTGNENNDQIVLDWKTLSEKDNDHFVIEKAADANHFVSMGTVKGNGTTDLSNQYSFIDVQPLKGWNYYRLKQIDFSGASDLSEIIAVKYTGSDNQIKMFPNPAFESISFLMNGTANEITEVAICDLNGKQILNAKLVSTVDIKTLPAGTYLVKIRSGNTEVIDKLVVVK